MKKSHKTAFFAAGALTLAAAVLASVYNNQYNNQSLQNANAAQTPVYTSAQQGAATQNSAGNSAPQTIAMSQTRLGSGSIQYEEDTPALTSEQESLLLDYIYAYYDSLANLSLGDPSGLFAEDSLDQAQTNQNIWEYLIAVRSMQISDLSLVDYDFTLTITRVEEQDDGSLRIRLNEDSVQNFAQHPDVDSESMDVRHVFTMKETDDGWKLSQHMQMDSLYYTMMGWTRRRSSDGAVQVSSSQTLDEMISLAQTYTASALPKEKPLTWLPITPMTAKPP